MSDLGTVPWISCANSTIQEYKLALSLYTTIPYKTLCTQSWPACELGPTILWSHISCSYYLEYILRLVPGTLLFMVEDTRYPPIRENTWRISRFLFVSPWTPAHPTGQKISRSCTFRSAALIYRHRGSTFGLIYGCVKKGRDYTPSPPYQPRMLGD